MRRAPCLALLALLACGDDDDGESVPPAPAWADLPAGFEPIELPPSADDCDGPVLFVGAAETHAVGVEAPQGFAALLGASEEDEALEGVASEVRAFVRPIAMASMSTGSYNGPGGEPYARWQLESPTPVLVLDRRVSKGRFAEVLRGARTDLHTPVRIGGVDARGGRRCAVGWLDTGSPGVREAPAWGATVDERGDLRVESQAGDPVRLARGSAPRAVGDGDFHIVTIRNAGDREPGVLLHALALARFGDQRYGAILVD